MRVWLPNDRLSGRMLRKDLRDLVGCGYSPDAKVPDPLFTVAFHDLLRTAGVEPVKLSPRSPNLNAYAERFVRSIKEECLDQMIIFGERRLREVIDEYVEHYHRERPHQGIGNALIQSSAVPPNPEDPLAGRQRLGGLLCSYHRVAP